MLSSSAYSPLPKDLICMGPMPILTLLWAKQTATVEFTHHFLSETHLRILLEVVIHPASDSVCLKAQVHILAVSMVDIVLVQDIIQTLIEILQVEENNCTSCLHANLDLVNIPTDLCIRCNLHCHSSAPCS
jgi:hypothetical protein